MERKIAIVFSSMARTGFDFVGIHADGSVAEGAIRLENPLVMDYGENRTLRGLAPLHMPYGIFEPMRRDSSITIPAEGIAYVIELPVVDDHEVARMYREFFTQKIPQYEDVRESDVGVSRQ